MIRFACGTCKERLVVPDRHAGRKGKCPKCGTINRVPAVSEFDELPPGTPVSARPDSAAEAPPALFPATVPPGVHRSGRALLDRMRLRFTRKVPAPAENPLDVYDAGGIPRAAKLLFVVGVLILIPLLIGAAFVILILLRVKLGN